MLASSPPSPYRGVQLKWMGNVSCMYRLGLSNLNLVWEIHIKSVGSSFLGSDIHKKYFFLIFFSPILAKMRFKLL